MRQWNQFRNWSYTACRCRKGRTARSAPAPCYLARCVAGDPGFGEGGKYFGGATRVGAARVLIREFNLPFLKVPKQPVRRYDDDVQHSDHARRSVLGHAERAKREGACPPSAHLLRSFYFLLLLEAHAAFRECAQRVVHVHFRIRLALERRQAPRVLRAVSRSAPEIGKTW